MIIAALLLFLSTLLVWIYNTKSQGSNEAGGKAQSEITKTNRNTDETEEVQSMKYQDEKKSVCVEDMVASRISDTEIQITWPDENNPYVKEYEVKRHIKGEDGWQTIGTLASDQKTEGRSLTISDKLKDSSIQQYEYRVDVSVSDEKEYEPSEGKTAIASNVLICIDPGHYTGKNQVEDADGRIYCEGDFTLEIAKELTRILEEDYGVSCRLTRDSENITIDGYTNENLDQAHISLRGEYATEARLFLSLHTNANLENANGCETKRQPIEINKPIIIVNALAYDTDYALQTANAIGSNLASVSSQLGLYPVKEFRIAADKNDIMEWTDAYNDKLGEPGTVCSRWGKKGDYYGVLRGAATVGVPGMIIEHGFHTVPEMRELALQGTLKTKWAEADAWGIAQGLGLKKGMEE